MEGVIIGIITGLSAVICQIIIARTNTKNLKQTQFDSQRLIEYKIDKLQEKVEKHNNLVERQYNIEKITAVLKEEIKVANHRIADLEDITKWKMH